MKYIKDVVIPDTKKRLKYPIILSEYFRMIGCRLIMECCIGHSVREFFSKDPITPQKITPIYINHIVSDRCL